MKKRAVKSTGRSGRPAAGGRSRSASGKSPYRDRDADGREGRRPFAGKPGDRRAESGGGKFGRAASGKAVRREWSDEGEERRPSQGKFQRERSEEGGERRRPAAGRTAGRKPGAGESKFSRPASGKAVRRDRSENSEERRPVRGGFSRERSEEGGEERRPSAGRTGDRRSAGGSKFSRPASGKAVRRDRSEDSEERRPVRGGFSRERSEEDGEERRPSQGKFQRERSEEGGERRRPAAGRTAGRKPGAGESKFSRPASGKAVRRDRSEDSEERRPVQGGFQKERSEEGGEERRPSAGRTVGRKPEDGERRPPAAGSRGRAASGKGFAGEANQKGGERRAIRKSGTAAGTTRRKKSEDEWAEDSESIPVKKEGRADTRDKKSAEQKDGRPKRKLADRGMEDTGRPGRKDKKDKKGRRGDSEAQSESLVRLNKFLADAGLASRRKADEMIKEGVVKVNRDVVTEPGTQVHPADLITVNGEPVSSEKRLTYILLNKPKGYITTTSDERGRKTVMDIIHTRARVFPVGRLDRNTTGVLLFTNDGELANRLMHPRYEIARVYSATLDKSLQIDDAKKISAGVELEDGMTKPCSIVIDPKKKNKVLLEITEGKNREVRRIFEALGYEVDKLDRKMYANLMTRGMKRGEFRHLTRQEVRELEGIVGIKNRVASTGQAPTSRRAPGRRGGRSRQRR